jgi:hypothetical protein
MRIGIQQTDEITSVMERLLPNRLDDNFTKEELSAYLSVLAETMLRIERKLDQTLDRK